MPDPAPDVPPRVLAAERRREFRELLAAGSLGCLCGHMLADHDADDWDVHGEPVGRRCRLCGCGTDEKGQGSE